MRQRKLKVIPIYKFFQIMDVPSRVAFLALWIGLVGLAVATVISIENPTQWSMEVVEVPATSSENVPLASYDSNYRTMTAEATATSENIAFAARSILPVPWMPIVFLIAFVLGWSYLLTAATYLKGYYGYGLALLYCIFLMLGEPFESISPDYSRLFTIVALLLNLAPLFLIQQGIWAPKFMVRLLSFVGLIGGTIGLTAGLSGWQALHAMTAEMFPVTIFVVLIFLFFVANDLNNLLFYLSTNAKKQSRRAPFPVIMGIWVVLIGLQFMMLQHEMGWNLVPFPTDFPFRPFHLVALASVVMVGTKQNMYPLLKDFVNNRAMSFGFLGFAVLAVSSLFYHSSLGDYLYIASFERVAIILFFLTSLFHFFYIAYNFMPLLQARLNFYFVSLLPNRLMYVFVVMATLLVGLAMEGSEYFRSRVALSASYYNRLGDAEMVNGNPPAAMTYYKAATAVAEGTVKGNYNFALLKWTIANEEAAAREHFQQACQFAPFPYAYVNLAALEMGGGLVESALYHLKKGEARVSNPHLHNNLAQVYLLLEEPDSAILQMKQALALSPGNSTFYGNLGKIYLDYERPKEAAKFFSEGLNIDPPAPSTVTNALFLNLSSDTSIYVADSLLSHPAVRNHQAAWYNMALARIRDKNISGARQTLDSLMAMLDAPLPDSLKGQLRPPAVQFLDGVLMFEEGQVENAVTRMDYLDANFPEFNVLTQHFLGAAFHGQGVPEMASEYYTKSVEQGRPDDLYRKALMEIDQGNQDKGFRTLSAAQIVDSTLFPLVAKESSMLQLAHGQFMLAQVGFDLNTMTANDWARVGLYAGQMGKIPEALEAFRKLTVFEPKSVVPYLEMGRISLLLNDSLAAENIKPGLDLEPDNSALQIELARAELRYGDSRKSLQMVNSLEKVVPQDYEFRFLQAEVALHQKDTATAIQILDTLHSEQPLTQKVVLLLSELYRKQREDFQAHELLVDALAINYQNPGYFAELARVEWLLGRVAESADAARTAIELETDMGRISHWELEFAEAFSADAMGPAYEDQIFEEE